jgi:hypothetical protein
MLPRSAARRRNPAVWIAVLLLFVGAALAAGEDELIKVHKEAVANGGGTSARNEAVRTAERGLILDILQATLSPENLSQAQCLADDPARYIRSTQILHHETHADATHVAIESFVRRKLILKDLAALLLPRMPAPPTVLVLLTEQMGADAPAAVGTPDGAAAALADGLRKAGLDVVDTSVLRACYADSDLVAAARADNETAARFAQQGFADVVILGNAAVASEAKGAADSVRANKATVSLRIFRAADGKQVETLGAEALVHSADPTEGALAALQDACAKLTEDTGVAIVVAAAGLSPSEDVLVTVEQPGARARFDDLIAALKQAVGDANVEPLFYTDALARIRIKQPGSIRALVETVCARPYQGTALETRKAFQRTVILRFHSP